MLAGETSPAPFLPQQIIYQMFLLTDTALHHCRFAMVPPHELRNAVQFVVLFQSEIDKQKCSAEFFFNYLGDLREQFLISQLSECIVVIEDGVSWLLKARR